MPRHFELVGPAQIDKQKLIEALRIHLSQSAHQWQLITDAPQNNSNTPSGLVQIAQIADLSVTYKANTASVCIALEVAPPMTPISSSHTYLSPTDNTPQYRVPYVPERLNITLCYIEAALTESKPADITTQQIQQKLRGQQLDKAALQNVLDTINQDKVDSVTTEAFLHACCYHLSDTELMEIAKIRSHWGPRIQWPRGMVVDKHSLGGIPGSRVTMIVVPIVAAHGMLIPKTSTRAITSAAGTADAMETFAKVDLSADKLRHVVLEAHGCIAWNRQLNHTRVDEALNRITRSLNIDTRRWAVASILSKKLTAGATHLVIDIPYGQHCKVQTLGEAQTLATLFQKVGQSLGMTVRAFPTPGELPIGRGIGPALEARDVQWVLQGHHNAPADLREKALFFAGQLLAFDPAIASFEKGYQRAEVLLNSGQAFGKLQQIIGLQGPAPAIDIDGAQTVPVLASSSGYVRSINGYVISGIARMAGAPGDKLAGVYLEKRCGDNVKKGETIFVIYGANHRETVEAAQMAARNPGYEIIS